MSGWCVYEGPSKIDGNPIFVLVTGSSRNVKTGKIFQSWIMRSDIHPVDAMQSKEDVSVCGPCVHRGTSCYVNLAFAPHQIYKKYAAGGYERLAPAKVRELVSGGFVRLGAYGDPAAVPTRVWTSLLKRASGYTGYTHQWEYDYCDPLLKQFCMASCENEKQMSKAHSMGWRTFRIIKDTTSIKKSLEILCPASKEMGYKLTCDQCGACNGTSRSLDQVQKRSVAIVGHGHKGKKNKLAKMVD